MKKIIAIFLLAVLLFSNVGGLLLFKIQQQINYQCIKNELRKTKQLTALTLSLADYKKSKVDKHEIKVAGKMYDVQQIVVTNSSVTVYCIADEKEDHLIASYQTLEQNKSGITATNTTLLKLLSLVYLQVKQNETTPAFVNLNVLFFAYSSAFQPALLSIESPPPKTV